ncbi:MAG: carboxypeptidase-like regulatory domain-containing protein, partial [Pricia sp.]
MKSIVLLLGLLAATSLSAQREFFKGKLLDAVTEEPIAFATVRVKGKSKGVISNADGGFRIPQIFKTYGDTLKISSMGYETLELRIVDLSPEKINLLRLDPGVFELREAVVSAKQKKALRAKQIVRRAIRNIPENYPQHSFSQIGYYRDYQKDEEAYVNLNEAIIEVFDQGFATMDSSDTKVRLYDYSRNTDFRQDSISSISYDYINYKKTIDDAYLYDYGGNEFTILRVHDAIRNYNVTAYSFVDRLDKNLLQQHRFIKEPDTYWNGESLYTIA